MRNMKKVVAGAVIIGIFIYVFNFEYFGYFLSLICNSAMECVTGGDEYSNQLAKEMDTLKVSKFISLKVNGKEIDLDNTDFGEDFYNDIAEEAKEESTSDALDYKILQAESAQKIAGDLSDKYGYSQNPNRKTVASDGIIHTLSGWKTLDADSEFTRVPVEEVIIKAKIIGHNLRNAGANDQGVPGKYNASHAEKQLSIISDKPIGISQPMCIDCQSYFRKLAVQEGNLYIVADPDIIRIFNPDGTITEIRRQED